jgi:hypothetical protein
MYIREHKHQLRELYEFMTEAEVSNLLEGAVDAQPLALSVEEVVKTVLGNLRAWQKKEAEISVAEARQKEKDLVNLLVDARTKYKAWVSAYVNPYEQDFTEMIAANPSVVDPTHTPWKFHDRRAAILHARTHPQFHSSGCEEPERRGGLGELQRVGGRDHGTATWSRR